MGIKIDHMTQTKLNEAIKIAGIQLQNEQICSRGEAFNNQSKQNDEEGSQSLSEKSGRKSCSSNNWRFPGEPRSLGDFFLEWQTVP